MMKHNKRLFVGILSASIALNSCLPAMAADKTNYDANRKANEKADERYDSHSENILEKIVLEDYIPENKESRSFSANEKVGYARTGMLHYDDNDSGMLSIQTGKINLEVGEVKAISVSGNSSRISWISSNPNVAAVDVNGRILAISKGSAKITAWYNGKRNTLRVKVKQNSIEGAASKAELYIPLGRSRTFPSIKGISKKYLNISSNNASVINIDSNSKKIKGITEGIADLIYDYNYTDKKGSHTGHGKIRCYVAGPKAEEKNISIKAGETQKLKLTGNYSAKTTWKSSNKKVVFVDEFGVVSGIKEGKATVTCKSGGKRIKYKVTVAGQADMHDHSAEKDDYLVWQQNRFTKLHFYKCGNFNIEQTEEYKNLLDNSNESNSKNPDNDNSKEKETPSDNNSPEKNTNKDKGEDSKNSVSDDKNSQKDNSKNNQKDNGSDNNIPKKDELKQNDQNKENPPIPSDESNDKEKNEEQDKERVIDFSKVYENENLKYKFVKIDDDKCGIIIVGLTDKGKQESVIVIPKNIDGYPVIAIEKDAFKGNSAVNIIVEADIDKSKLPEELSGSGKGKVFNVLHKYRVIHEKETLDGNYEEAEREEFEAEGGSSVIPEAKEYFGFETPAYQVLQVGADDKSELVYRYSRKKFAVSVNAGRGIAAVSGSGVYKYEEEAVVYAETKPGYNFDGWSGDISNWLNDKLESRFKMPAGNVEVTAKATPVDYRISYDLRGGQFKDKPEISYNTESENFVLKNPEKAGYEFAGWVSKESSIPEMNLMIKKGSIDDRDYIAAWKARNDTPYTVYHEKERMDGSYETVEIEKLKGTTDKQVTPTVKNYEGFTKPVEQTIIIEADGSAQATYRYKRLSYNLNVKYGKGFSVQNRNEKHKFQEAITISTALKNGYKLSTVKDGSGRAVNTKFTMPANDMTVIAEAVPETYSITYNLNGGNNNPKNPGKYTIETNSFSLQAPTRTGYTFAGWTGSSLKGNSYNVDFEKDKTYGNKSYTANWTANHYTVNFNTDGGNAVSPIKVVYGSKVGNLPTPAKSNYVFTGWYNKSGVKVDSNLVMPAENITLTARWQHITRKITVDASGGVLADGRRSYSLTGKYGDKINLQTPKRAGYNFGGWSVKGAGNVAGNTFTVGSGDSTITPKWVAINYTLTLNANGGKISGAASRQGTINSKVSIPSPTKDGYVFGGWKLSGSGQLSGSNYTFADGNATVTAIWNLPSSFQEGKLYFKDEVKVPAGTNWNFVGFKCFGVKNIRGKEYYSLVAWSNDGGPVIDGDELRRRTDYNRSTGIGIACLNYFEKYFLPAMSNELKNKVSDLNFYYGNRKLHLMSVDRELYHDSLNPRGWNATAARKGVIVTRNINNVIMRANGEKYDESYVISGREGYYEGDIKDLIFSNGTMPVIYIAK